MKSRWLKLRALSFFSIADAWIASVPFERNLARPSALHRTAHGGSTRRARPLLRRSQAMVTDSEPTTSDPSSWLEDAVATLEPLAGTPAAVDVLRKAVLESPPGTELSAELFSALFKFKLDEFQLEALRALSRRNNVVVSAPTGSGKTVAGELAIYYALALGLRVFYTTPLKALSNQKFSDFRKQYGHERVGLLTGDSGVNRDAQIVVMTTEVYRNMLYESGKTGSSGSTNKKDTTASTDLRNVFAVVFDEFHYMNDPQRGTVWEESVISTPSTVLMVALSATVRNVRDITGWFTNVHGQPTSLVSSDFRPVPLRYYFATSEGIKPLFKDADAGPGALKSNFGRNSQSDGSSQSDDRTRGSGEVGNAEGPDNEAKELTLKHAENLKKRKKRNQQQSTKKGNNFSGPLIGGSKLKKMSRRQRRQGVLWEGALLNPDLLPAPLLLPTNNEELTVEELKGLFDDKGWGKGGGSSGSGGGRDRGSSSSSSWASSRQKSNANSGYLGGSRKDRPRGSNEVASYPYLVRNLARKKMLPAIVFIFSRTGCDNAAREVARLNWGPLINEEESDELERRLKLFEKQQPKGTQVEPERLSLLRSGVGVHHAGLLPLHKSLVEDLFNSGLLKVCFATETLAAGVNMPARSTVVSVLSKRTDRGVGPLSVAQLLQMAGRAGRRGKDVQGNVILMRSRFEDATAAHRLLLSPIDAIDSHFRSGYGMVATILRKYSTTQAREMVERSFGSYLSGEAAKAMTIGGEEGHNDDHDHDDHDLQTSSSAFAESSVSCAAAKQDQEGQEEEEEVKLSWAVASLTLKLAEMGKVLSTSQSTTQHSISSNIGGGDSDSGIGQEKQIKEGVDASSVKAYVKLRQRIESEERSEKYLIEQRIADEATLLQNSVLPFARLGSAVVLRSKKATTKEDKRNAGMKVVKESSGVKNRRPEQDGDEEQGDVDEKVVVAAALLGDAPSSFFGRKETLFMALLLSTTSTSTPPSPSSTPPSSSSSFDNNNNNNNNVIIKPQLALVEARHVQSVDSSDLYGLSSTVAVALQNAVISRPSLALPWRRRSSGVWVAEEDDDDDEERQEGGGDKAASFEGTLMRRFQRELLLGGGGAAATAAATASAPVVDGDAAAVDVAGGDKGKEEFSSLAALAATMRTAGGGSGVDDKSATNEAVGEVAAQQHLIKRLQETIQSHPLHDLPNREQVISAVLESASVEVQLKQATKQLSRLRRRKAAAEALAGVGAKLAEQRRRRDGRSRGSSSSSSSENGNGSRWSRSRRGGDQIGSSGDDQSSSSSSSSPTWVEFSSVAKVLKAYGALKIKKNVVVPTPSTAANTSAAPAAAAASASASASTASATSTASSSASSSSLNSFAELDIFAEALFEGADEDESGQLSKAELWDAFIALPNLEDLLLPLPPPSSTVSSSNSISTSSSSSSSSAAAARRRRSSSSSSSSSSPIPSVAERLERVGLLLEELDTNGDGEVDLGELKNGLRRVFAAAPPSSSSSSIAPSSSASSTTTNQSINNNLRAGDKQGGHAPEEGREDQQGISERRGREVLGVVDDKDNNSNDNNGNDGDAEYHELTPFGELVASLNCDNELWLALALQHPCLQSLSEVELAGVVCSLMVDYSRPDLFTLYGPSPAVMAAVQAGLAPLAEDLISKQFSAGLYVSSVPVNLDPRLAGLVESWAEGSTDWGQLCASTSLDQGDLCRVLRRTMEVLRSMALSDGLASSLRDKARSAMKRIDRAPVTDDGYVTLKTSAEMNEAAAAAEEEEEEEEEEEKEEEEKEEESEGENDEGPGV